MAISVHLSVRHGHSLSRAMNLHISGLGHSQINLMSLSCLMGLAKLSVLAYFMGKRSLKYFVFSNCFLRYECSASQTHMCGLYPLQRSICSLDQCPRLVEPDCSGDLSPLCAEQVGSK